jgi:hypothetical protein
MSSVGKFSPAVFATKNPEPNEVIWLVASLSQERGLLHRGKVLDIRVTQFGCKFDNGNIVLRGASGAPYINAKGEVVGLHLSSTKEPGNNAGYALSVETIKQALKITNAKQ